MSLPNDPIIIGYGNVRWGTLCETLAMNVKPVLDGASRSVKWTQYDFTLKFVVGEDNQLVGMTTDITVATLRAELMRVGLEFHYLRVGYGALQSVPPGAVNTFGLPTNSHDVVWGPRPTSLQYKPAGNQAAECVWSCTVCLAPCPEDMTPDGMLEYVWKVSYGIDQSGYATRTTSGYVRVVGARPSPDARTVTDQADRLRERINPPLQPGFRRIPGTFTLNEDKARMDFTVTDVEVGPNYPPAGCVEAQASHTLNSGGYFGTRATGTLAATYEVARNRPIAEAEKWFAELYKDRVLRSRNVKFKTLAGKAETSSVIMKSLEYGDPEIYGKQTATFRLEYDLLVSVNELMRVSRIWQPVPNTDWARWSASLANTAFSVRGNARLAFAAGDEAIIDICEDANIPRAVRGGPPFTPRGGLPEGKLRNETPDPRTSWLHYYCWLRLVQTDESIEHKPLPVLPPDQQQPRRTLEQIARGSGDPTRSLRSVPGDEGSPLAGFTKAGFRGSNVEPIASAPRPLGVSANLPPPTYGGRLTVTPGASVVQRRAPSTFHAILEGFAARAGHPIAPPTLTSVGGVTAVPANRADRGDGFHHGMACEWMGCPIYFARWQQRFILPSRPDGELTIPGNPFLGV